MSMEDTIAAISTPIGVGGIGIVRLSGSQSLNIVNNIFRTKSGSSLDNFHNRHFYYGYIVKKNGDVLDEVLMVVMKAPGSYTREDMAEIHCHGGIVPLSQILKLVIRHGARLAEPGEFTKRAFLNGRIDLSQAEAIMDLICAKTEKSAKASIKQMEGELSSRICAMREDMLDLMAHIEVSIDYPEEDIEDMDINAVKQRLGQLKHKMSHLLDTAEQGKLIRHGIKTVIVGKPNVGKSSLLNALLGENRAIVTEIPGTTRDIIEESVNIKEVLVRIIDTAGIRKTTDMVEEMGVERSKQNIEDADLILWVMDASRPIEDEDREILDDIQHKKTLIILNKMDCPVALDFKELKSIAKDIPIVKACMINQEGIEEIKEYIHNMVISGKVSADDGVIITNIRHQEALINSLQHVNDALISIDEGVPLDLISIDIRGAWDALGSITGETITEDLIDKIFSEFCLGK